MEEESQNENEAACETHEHAGVRPAFLDDPVMEAAFVRAARMFSAAGDPARLRLLGILLTGERCVTELSDLSGAKMNTVSQQLKLLRLENLIVSRRDGKHLFYALADDHVRTLVDDVLTHASHNH